jgi:hypothetical protein
MSAWAERYPSFEHVVFDYSAILKISASRFPDYVPVLASLQTGVQRSDVARLLILAAYGGVYADIDASPASRDLDDLLSLHPHSHALFFEEAVLSPAVAAAARWHAIRDNAPEARQRIANYFMASAPSSPSACAGGAALAILEVVKTRVRSHPTLSQSDADYEVLYTTGPDAVTDAVHVLRGWNLGGDDIVGTTRLDPGSDIETVVRTEKARDSSAQCADVVPRPLDQRYFSHDAVGAWKGRT